MDQINELYKEFEDARANNRQEWESFGEDIKAKINGYNEMLATYKLKQNEIEERTKALTVKQDDYKRKHTEFEIAVKDKKMTNEEAVKKIKEE